ncbi:MAG: amino acid permease [Acidobacteria bacterium]|nr:amino acid permease [Acidobacteriota bacterium]
MKPHGELRRQIGLTSAAAIVAGEVIAVGIFLTPAGMAKSLGSPFWLLVVWLVMGIMALSGAFCYGELAARFPEAGGGYVYLREAYGRRFAFIYGWKCFLVMDPGLTAALAAGVASYVGYFVKLPPAGLKLVAITAIGLLTAINLRGVKPGAGMLRALTVLKLGALTFIPFWAIALRLGNFSNFLPLVAQRPGSAPLAGALAGAMVSAFFSFGGWWDLSKLGGEVRDPGKTMPRALMLGVAAVTVVYVMTSAVFIYLVPIEQVTSGETFAAQAGEALFGTFGGQVLSLIVVISVLGSLAAVMMAAPRVYFAMARDGLFFRGVAEVSERTGAPSGAILLQAMLASLLVVIGTFDQIIAYFIFVTVLFLAMTVASIFILRKRTPVGSNSGSSAGRFQIPGYPIPPIVFLTLVALLLILLGANNPKQALLGLLVAAAGWPAYYLFSRRGRSDETESD